VVADAVAIEPVSASKFPDNWENTGKFACSAPDCALSLVISEQNQRFGIEIPVPKKWEFHSGSKAHDGSKMGIGSGVGLDRIERV
jgi:hypothetical protein